MENMLSYVDQPKCFGAGVKFICPHCKHPSYTEKLGQPIDCPECGESFTITEEGVPIGSEVECPYCEELFYTEALGESVDCPECGESFTAIRK
jgi:predicted Zn finger-like uncharacterized protein